jgi:hypothetical protein
MTSPQASQQKVRSANPIRCFSSPQREQVLVDGNQRSATMTCPPRQACL